jgi:CheY-like chemotaxis protein
MIKQYEILWVDDEPELIEPFIRELRQSREIKFNVHHFERVDVADVEFARLAEVTGVVLDVMMPGGDLFTPAATKENQTTGLLLLQRWKDQLLRRNQPVIILTNRAVSDIESFVQSLKFPEDFVKVYHKAGDTSAKLFVEQLGKHLLLNDVKRLDVIIPKELISRVYSKVESWQQQSKHKVKISENAIRLITIVIQNIGDDPATSWKMQEHPSIYQNQAIEKLPCILNDLTANTNSTTLSSWSILHRISRILDDYCPVPKK